MLSMRKEFLMISCTCRRAVKRPDSILIAISSICRYVGFMYRGWSSVLQRPLQSKLQATKRYIVCVVKRGSNHYIAGMYLWNKFACSKRIQHSMLKLEYLPHYLIISLFQEINHQSHILAIMVTPPFLQRIQQNKYQLLQYNSVACSLFHSISIVFIAKVGTTVILPW